MEQETISSQPIPAEKVYQERQLWVGSYLGGPLAAGFILAKNFRVFGEAGKARMTWIVTVVVTILLFAVVLFAPYVDRIPNFLIPLAYTIVASLYFQRAQGANVAAHLEAGGAVQSWWRVVGVAVVGLIVTLAVVLGTFFVSDSIANRNVTTKTYGAAKHEITFDKSNVSEAEADKIADALGKADLLEGDGARYFHLKKVADDYEISFYIDKTVAKNKPELLDAFADFRDKIQQSFPNNRIAVKLVGDDTDDVIKRFD